jgi:TP901 family phage tail tape measure protein
VNKVLVTLFTAFLFSGDDMAATLGIATLETKVDLKGLDKGLKQGEQKTRGFLDIAKEGFAQQFGFSAAEAAIMAAKAIKQFADESIAEFQTFQKGMSEVFTLMPGMSKSAMDSMKEDVIDFGKEVGRTTDEVVPAMYQAISAGVPAENVFDFMKIASDAALGGVTDLETAVDGISSVVNAYGDEVIDAATASDVMFTAVKLGKTDFEQLSASLFNVVPTAASLGVTFTDVAANLAALTAQGTPTSVATTQLRAAFVEASKSGTVLDKAIRDLTGKSFAELIASGKTSSQIFSELRQSMPEQDFRNLFSSVEASNAVMGLTNDTAAGIIDTFGTVEDTIGATAAAAETMAGSLEHLEARSEAATEAFKIQVGEGLTPLKQMYLETKIAGLSFLGTQVQIAGEFWRGNLGLAETIKLQNQLAFTSMDAAEAMTELENMTTGSTEATRAYNDAAGDYYAAQAAAVEATKAATEAAEADALAIREAAQARAEAAGINEEFADKVLQSANHLTAEEAAVAAANAANAAYFDEIESGTPAVEDFSGAAAEAAQQLGGYFDAALTATGETKSLERQLYDSAVAAGAGAAELAVLAAATGEFTAAEIEAAFQAALMQANIDGLVAAMQSGSITAEEATQALGRLKDGQADTAAAAIQLAKDADAANAAFDELSGAAVDAATNLAAIPTNIPVHISVTSDPFPTIPNYPGGGNQPQAFADGGFTGFGPMTEPAGVVHRNELVLPAQTLRAGPAAILDFADSHLPGGLPSGRGQAVVNDNRQFHWNVNTAAFNPESAGRAAAAFATGGI